MYQYKFNHVLCLCSDTSGGEGMRAIRELKQRPSTGSEAKTLEKTSSVPVGVGLISSSRSSVA